MEITDPVAMAEFAKDVRLQEQPFTAAAAASFTDAFAAEYRRLRAAALESGDDEATLNVTVRCNFDPQKRSVEILTCPAHISPKPLRRAAAVN